MPGGALQDFHGISVTAKMAAYCGHVVNGVDETTAAELAGYEFPASAVTQLKRDPKISEAISRALIQQVTTEAAPAAYKRLLDLVTDRRTPPGVALKASTWILETAGVKPVSENGTGGLNGESLDNMSLAELEATAKVLKQRLHSIPVIEGEARTIEHRQQNGQQDGQAATSKDGKTLDDLMS